MTSQPPPPSRYQPTSSDERNYRRIRLRQDTDANWRIADPILATGEFGYTIAPENSPTPPDPGQCLKIGDGITSWTNLPYLAAQGSTGPAGPPGQGIEIKGTIDYPGPPTDPPTDLSNAQPGDFWIDSNGNGWAYQGGTFWTDAGPVRGANFEVYIQPDEPTPVLYGAMWFKSVPNDNAIINVYVWDTVQWVKVIEASQYRNFVFKPPIGTTVINSIDINGNQLQFDYSTLTVSVNGVELVKDEDYVEGIAGQEIVLTEPTDAADDVVSLTTITAFLVNTINSVVYADKPVTLSQAGNAITVGLDVADTPDISNGTPLMMVDAEKFRNELDTMIQPSERTSFDPLNPPTTIIAPMSSDLNLAVRDLDSEVARLSNADTMACTYDASINQIVQATAAGSAIVPPFVPGQDLPTPIADYKGYYAYVTADGLYGGNAVRQGDSIGCDGTQWIIFPFSAPPAPVSSVFGRIGDITPLSGDYAAAQVSYDSSNTTLSANTTQGAIDELAVRTPTIPVVSVFGRTGDVLALHGDYTAEQIPYDNSNTTLVSGSTQGAITELADNAANGVLSVHGRTGNVVGNIGDYSAPQVSFSPNGTTIILPTSTDIDLAIRDLDTRVAQVSLSHVLVGTYDGSTQLVDMVTAAGAAAGFVAGQPLPAPSPAIDAHYLLVTAAGNGLAVNDRLWCDGTQWLTVQGGGSGTAPVTSVFGRIGVVTAQNDDYAAQQVSYAGTATGAQVKAALDGLADRIAALEARPYLLGTFSRHGKDASWAWHQSGGATGNIGQLNRHSANMESIAWGDHGVSISGNDLRITKAGLYQIMVECQIGSSSVNNKHICLDVGGNYTNSFLRNDYNQDSPYVWHQWYRKTNTTTTIIQLNLYGGGASFDYGVPSISIVRFSA